VAPPSRSFSCASSRPTVQQTLCCSTSAGVHMSSGSLRFYSELPALCTRTPIAEMSQCPRNGDSGRYLSQLPIFCRFHVKGRQFDILTKGSLLRPPNRTKSKNHHEYFLSSFPLTISAKRKQGLTEVSLPMARATRRAPTHRSEEGIRATFVEPLGRQPPMQQAPRAAHVNQSTSRKPPRVPTAHINSI
jgi:hypothetical protein